MQKQRDAAQMLDEAILKMDKNTERFKEQFAEMNISLDKIVASKKPIVATIILVGAVEALAICSMIAFR